ncbi:Uncharacterized protein ChrSV_3838 [Chromobacterium vaccinii]|nr:Uncharacterized protein ChrSW_3838 [Chromobacterium vaccinii]QND91295.1 Uncharacterized protein ChrSV_3838 [Chromobacterium vaccinii]
MIARRPGRLLNQKKNETFRFIIESPLTTKRRCPRTMGVNSADILAFAIQGKESAHAREARAPRSKIS